MVSYDRMQEDLERQIAEQQRKYEEEAARKQKADFDNQMNELQLTYNPIQTTVGPDGTKSYSLIKELQLQGPEKFIQSERERLGQQQALSLDDLQKQQAQAQAQQQSKLAQYGMKGSNPALLSRYSMRDALMARQGLGRQFQTQAGDLESKGQQMAQDIQQKNVGLMGQAMKDVEAFNLDKYKQVKAAQAAKQSAQATREATKDTK